MFPSLPGGRCTPPPHTPSPRLSRASTYLEALYRAAVLSPTALSCLQADTSSSSYSVEVEEDEEEEEEAISMSSNLSGRARPSLHRVSGDQVQDVDWHPSLKNRSPGVSLLDLSGKRFAGGGVGVAGQTGAWDPDSIATGASSSEEEEEAAEESKIYERTLPGTINSSLELMTAAPSMSLPLPTVTASAGGEPAQHSDGRLSEAGRSSRRRALAQPPSVSHMGDGSSGRRGDWVPPELSRLRRTDVGKTNLPWPPSVFVSFIGERIDRLPMDKDIDDDDDDQPLISPSLYIVSHL